MTSEQIQVPRLTNEEETQIITRNFFLYYSHWQNLKRIVDLQG